MEKLAGRVGIPPLKSDVVGGVGETSLSSKVAKFFADYGLVATGIVVLTSYVGFIWQINTMIMGRADKEIELQGQISELKGIVQILIEDRKDITEYKLRVLEAGVKVASSSCVKN